MTPTLPGMDDAPSRQVFRLTETEANMLRRYRQEQRQMELRHKNRLEHVLANLSSRWPSSITGLWRRLNTGRLGVYTRAQVDALLDELVRTGKARRDKHGIFKA